MVDLSQTTIFSELGPIYGPYDLELEPLFPDLKEYLKKTQFLDTMSQDADKLFVSKKQTQKSNMTENFELKIKPHRISLRYNLAEVSLSLPLVFETKNIDSEYVVTVQFPDLNLHMDTSKLIPKSKFYLQLFSEEGKILYETNKFFLDRPIIFDELATNLTRTFKQSLGLFIQDSKTYTDRINDELVKESNEKKELLSKSLRIEGSYNELIKKCKMEEEEKQEEIETILVRNQDLQNENEKLKKKNQELEIKKNQYTENIKLQEQNLQEKAGELTALIESWKKKSQKL